MSRKKTISFYLIALIAIIATFSVMNNTNVIAATKTIQTMGVRTEKKESLAYDKNGNSLYTKKDLVKTNAIYKYYGNPQRIKGQKYICYYIGNGKYIPLDWIKKVNGKNTIRLLRNSYVYNKYGHKLNKLSVSYPVYFTGKLKKQIIKIRNTL